MTIYLIQDVLDVKINLLNVSVRKNMENLIFYKPYENPEKHGYCRLPQDVALATSDAVARLASTQAVAE
jgi:hypothetical protein